VRCEKIFYHFLSQKRRTSLLVVNIMKSRHCVEKTSTIAARPNDIFKVLIDLGRWNTWTKSVTEMSTLNNDQPGPGVKIKVLQPKLPPAIWTITAFDPDKSFIWEKRSFGLRMLAEHLMLGAGNETSVTLRISYEGPLSGLFYILTRSMTDRYVGMEIDGLKKECEKGIYKHEHGH
jgi:Polyketide cyclase / dehydrase and lipid transport